MFLKSVIKPIINDLDLFGFGVRLYQLGRYEDALDFLSAFREKFPSREVFNNIGLARYALAVRHLAEYDRNRAFQYRLSTILDTRTEADKLRGDNTQQQFKENIREAIREFKAASEKDPSYLPARVNLSSALILAEKYSEAMAASDEALTISKDDPQAPRRNQP